MRVIVTGSCGYKGTVLVPKLVKAGHLVTGIDTCWFSDLMPNGTALIKEDIRNLKSLPSADAIIHLAGIANDPCGELDGRLTWEVNVWATMQLAEMSIKAGIRQFIFASSASVYGLKDNRPVIETDSMAPVSDYNRTKQAAERVLLSYADKMAIQLVRPATVCGLSPRMRLDTMVNMLTMQALEKGTITAHCGEHGGELMRPNTHIEDVTDLYLFMLDHPELTGAYNAGFENLSAMETAEMIASIVPAEISITAVKDKRSYAVCSQKLLSTGFRPKWNVRNAIEQIAKAYAADHLKNEERCMNLHWMRKNGWVSEAR